MSLAEIEVMVDHLVEKHLVKSQMMVQSISINWTSVEAEDILVAKPVISINFCYKRGH